MEPDFAFVANSPGVSDDFNGDNKMDLFTIAETYTDWGDYEQVGEACSSGRGDGTSVLKQWWPFSTYVREIGTGDLNGDGRPDLAIMNDNPGDGILQVDVMLNDGVWGWGPYLPQRRDGRGRQGRHDRRHLHDEPRVRVRPPI